MAKPTAQKPPQFEAKEWTRTSLDAALRTLRRRLAELEALDTEVTRHDSHDVEALQNRIKESIRDAYGLSSTEYDDHKYFKLSDGPMRMNMSDAEHQANYVQGVARGIAIVHGLIRSLEERLEDLPLAPEQSQQGPSAPAFPSDRVFLVHGHAVLHQQTVARFLERIGLEAVILAEQPNLGQTLIEKLENNTNVGFAVILLTGDDVGRSKGAPPSDEKLRARQNVVLELSFFMAHLGRGHTCVLYEQGVELPSDFSGVVYVALDAAGAWKRELGRELDAASVPIDHKALLTA